jgi:hypothetical protein
MDDHIGQILSINLYKIPETIAQNDDFPQRLILKMGPYPS